MTNQSNTSGGRLTEARTPWSARSDGDDDGLWTVEDASGGIVFFGMDEDRAHLFAAAPEMLAALKAFIYANREMQDYQLVEEEAKARSLAVAAVAKAEGSTP